MSKNSIVLTLQQEALKPDASATALLRTAKVIATKLDLKEALVWINNELDGYPNTLAKDLPEYRRLNGIPKAWNPYHGWQTIHAQSGDALKNLSFAPIGQAIGAIEHDLRDNPGNQGTFSFPYPPELKIRVQKAINWNEDVHIEIGKSQLVNIIDQVKNLVLNWTLELEAAGVLGDEMSFTREEKHEAPSVSQQFFIQNAAVVGDVSGQSRVSNYQMNDRAFDPSAIESLMTQTLSALQLLPATIRPEIERLISELKEQSQTANKGKIAELLSSVRKVAESASGNLTAQGLVQLVRVILGT